MSQESAALQEGLHLDAQQDLANLTPPALIAACTLLMLTAEASHWPVLISILATLLAFSQCLAHLAMRRSVALGLGLTAAGCLVTIAGAAWGLRAGGLLCLLALPVALGVLLRDLKAGALVALAASGLSVGLVSGPLADQPGTLLVALACIWGSLALFAAHLWAVRRAASTLWANYLAMYDRLQQTRDERLELKQAQQDLLQANVELARLSERLQQMCHVADEARLAKEQFVANVSHELRTPLNMIIGFSEIISQTPETYRVALPPSLLADVDAIRRNARHLANLVDDVLDMSQVEAGRMSLSREWVSLGEVVGEAVAAVRPLVEGKGLAIDVDVAADLPEVFCDRTRIRQVLLNLVSNAARFTEEGGISIAATAEDGRVAVAVTDTGPGIAPADHERIFEPFRQVDGTIRRGFGGTGLGLSISRRFVEMHDGRMWVESALGRGSTFHFTLPVREAAPPAESVLRWLSLHHQEFGRTRPSRAPMEKPRPRLVVLEEGHGLQRLLARYLDDCDIVPVRRLEEALTDLRDTPAQALIVNGASAPHEAANPEGPLSHLPFGTPTIACWVPGEEEAARRLGVVHYLLKPVTREALVSAMDSLPQPVRTVLVVDDQPDVVQLLGRMLASLERGYHVLRASSGAWALDLLRERRPDVMLLDLMMEGMDGRSVLERKSADPELREIPVIAVSAVDPTHGPPAGHALTLFRSGGLTSQDLLSGVRLWSGLNPAPGE